MEDKEGVKMDVRSACPWELDRILEWLLEEGGVEMDTRSTTNDHNSFFIMAFRSGVVLVLYAIHAGAAKTTLSAELTNLLPSCAHSCFTSFLDFNFALTKCGINPTLDCLCTTKSSSDYTVGEGAVQCVLTTAACNNGTPQGRLAWYLMFRG